MLDLWALCRCPGGMGGMMKLPPGPGGMGCQPAALMDAFEMIDQMLAKRQPGD